MADQWEEATRKLIRLTEAGELNWANDHALADRRQDDMPVVGPAYTAEASGKRISVFEVRNLHWDEDGHLLPWTGTNVVIEFVDENGETEWVWPSPKGRYELLEAIRYQQSNAGTFLESFLATESSA